MYTAPSRTEAITMPTGRPSSGQPTQTCLWGSNSATGLDLGFYAARLYWLMRPYPSEMTSTAASVTKGGTSQSPGPGRDPQDTPYRPGPLRKACRRALVTSVILSARANSR